MDHFAQLGVVIRADVLQHADRGEDVELAANRPIVVLDELDARLQPLGLGVLAGRADLLAGDVIGLHVDAVMPRHVKGQCPPAASRLDHRFSRLEPELAADQFHLGHLRFFQGNLGRRKIGQV